MFSPESANQTAIGTVREVIRARLRRITGPFLLRRLKTDRTVIDDLPEKFEVRQPAAERFIVEHGSPIIELF